MHLEKWQRNALYKGVEEAGLNPADFELGGDDAQTTIAHRSSESRFMVGGDARKYSVKYVVGDRAPRGYDVYGWREVESRLATWAKEAKEDLETPDLWAELEREREVLTGAPEERFEDALFTADEQAELAKQLRDLKEYVKSTYSLSEHQSHVLEARLDYLEVAASRLGRTDWRAVAVGTVAAFVLSSAFPPEAVRHVVTSLVRLIGHHYGFPELPSG